MAEANQDWKGEHLIKGITSDKDRQSETRSVVARMWHNKRRAAGAPAPGSANHSRFVKAVIYNTQSARA